MARGCAQTDKNKISFLKKKEQFFFSKKKAPQISFCPRMTKHGLLMNVAEEVFCFAYGLNGFPKVEHLQLIPQIMKKHECSFYAVAALLYGTSYNSLLGELRAQVPCYVPQKAHTLHMTKLPDYCVYDKNKDVDFTYLYDATNIPLVRILDVLAPKQRIYLTTQIAEYRAKLHIEQRFNICSYPGETKKTRVCSLGPFLKKRLYEIGIASDKPIHWSFFAKLARRKSEKFQKVFGANTPLACHIVPKNIIVRLQNGIYSLSWCVIFCFEVRCVRWRVGVWV